MKRLFFYFLMVGLLAQGYTITAQQLSISGTVSSDDGEGIPGVNILVKGTTTGTVTDIDGNYVISVDGNVTLVFSSIGFVTQEVSVANRTSIDIIMETNVEALDEVMIVAYGTVKKRDLTGSISSVKGKDMEKVAVTSLDQALQGRAAGVQVTQVSGRPGGETSIRIRGSSSINAGNEPLYVVDGMLIASGSGDLNSGGAAGASLNPLAAINPSDIESIEILKDASATALYGARGANGVILITTKRGQEGRTSVTLDSYYGVQEITNTLDLLNGEEFAAYMNAYNDEADLPADVRYLIPENIGDGTDWQNAIFREAPMMSHQLTITGGDKSTSYSVSGGYFKQDGIILNSDFERATFRTNLDKNVGERFKLGTRVNLSQINSRGVLTGAQSPSGGVLLPGSVSSAVLFTPTLPVLDADEPGGWTYEDDRGRDLPNPVADAQDTDNISKNTRIIASVFGELEITDGLTFKANFGADVFSVKENRFVPNYLKRTEPNNGEAVISTVDGQSWLTEYTFNYKKEFNEDHKLDALAGYTRQGFTSERLFAFTLDFADNRLGYHNLGAGINPQAPANGESEWGMISYLARVNYNYKSKYLFTANARVDGSSRFGEDSKYGFFPSVALAYNIADEDFIQNLGVFESLKLRTSYGVIGNSEIGSFNSLATVGPVGQGTFSGVPYNGVEPLRLANPELRWERTGQFNLGLDMAFLKGRIMVTTDYYIQNTTDLLLLAPVPRTSGFNNFFNNIGGLRNTGIELAINGILVDNDNFSWNSDFNISSNRNEITELADENDVFIPGVLNVPTGWSILTPGEAIGTFYGLIADGIFQTNEEAENSPRLLSQSPVAGERKYRDINGRDENGNLTGQPDGLINDADRAVIGRAQPKFSWNFINSFRYKGVDLSIFVQAVHGNDIVNAYRTELETLTSETNVYRDTYLNRWTEDNPSNRFRKLAPTDVGAYSSAHVEDGSFIRIKNINLGYTLPRKVLDRLKLNNFRAYISVNNLLTITDYTGYDPEVNAFGQNALLQGIDYGGYPIARTFIAGIQIGI
ncbi:MAG: TonB-dependent receptor [Cyclobacteriaceae bacterium]